MALYFSIRAGEQNLQNSEILIFGRKAVAKERAEASRWHRILMKATLHFQKLQEKKKRSIDFDFFFYFEFSSILKKEEDEEKKK